MDKYLLPFPTPMKLGLKMRYNETLSLPGFTPQMIELHLADEDLSEHRREIIDALSVVPEMPVVIHTQQNLYRPMERRPLVDPAAQNEKQRQQSIEVIGKTLSLAGEINADYVIVHPGGITPRPVNITDHFYFRLHSAILEIERDYDTHQILLENMPWFYWMWGGKERWYSNIMRFPEEFGPFLEYTGVVLDVCHAYLSVKEGSNEAIFRFLRELRRHIRHIHLSDAAAPDREGLQFAEGEIELRRLFRAILDMEVTAIPEIKGGHLNNREGFQTAVERFRDILMGKLKDGSNTTAHGRGDS